ncbi:MAG TPA: hypothetical protein VJT15_02255 [Pyrinomonadaceae bacterium]|nr:hypothetical protein [Pyrinomonadaceae bacterium]
MKPEANEEWQTPLPHDGRKIGVIRFAQKVSRKGAKAQSAGRY